MSGKNEILQMSDLPVIPTTIGDMSFNRTGLWRYLKPVIQNRSAPCRTACPLGMSSPEFIRQIMEQDWAKALDLILGLNPLPGITGRLCYHPCQSKCLRRGLDQAVQIQTLEKYIADTAPEPEPRIGEQNKGRVAVLGAGPLGLSAAYFLARAGLMVTVFDPLDQAGGFLTLVDRAKLPVEVMTRETARLIRLVNLRMVLGQDFAAAETGNPDSFSMFIHDKTAHTDGSAPANSLTQMIENLEPGRAVLNSEEVCPGGTYKVSQVAVAVAAGRDLALKALTGLELKQAALELEEAVECSKAAESVGRDEINYRLFDPQKSSLGNTGQQSITQSQALAEAERCLSCGHCNLCGRCLVFCPDVSLSVNEVEQKPQVDLKHCKGCGICAHECPRGVIAMEKQ